MKFKSLLILPILLLVCNSAISQNNTIDVNKDVDVTKVYEQVVKEGYGTPVVYLKLANAHYFKGNYAEARKWFEKVFEGQKPTDKKILFRYKQTLKALKQDLDTNKYLSVSVVEQND
ncbi:MAG: tetratricopeptide repeat protein [Flavobacteriaceae bacterium]|nr:tetratricopeptide repeat protein [Flavobacteriaceae bacterium]